MSPAAVEAAITPRTKAIIPVHIYGLMADIESLSNISIKNNLLLIEDCAQAHGAMYKGKKAGTFGNFGTYSFYPTKNLGAYGDGGAIATNDRQLAERLYRIRNYGQAQKYVHVERGVNSRLDELQAAILSVKLQYLDQHNTTRKYIASLYEHNLNTVIIPETRPNYQHVYHLYVVRHSKRDQLRDELSKVGIGTAIHYPTPVHLQKSHASLGMQVGSLPVTEKIVQEIISLPMFIGLKDDEVRYVCEQTRNLTEVLN
jgi:dTDP-4-amino-4,6-dideoxygalactose transaminase